MALCFFTSKVFIFIFLLFRYSLRMSQVAIKGEKIEN
jgi:hypothetical protein